MGIKKSLFCLLFVFAFVFSKAQVTTEFEKLLLFQQEQIEIKQKIYLQMLLKKQLFFQKNKHFHHFSPSGTPIYYQNRGNINTANTLGTSQLWTDGGLGLEINGQNMITDGGLSYLGVWEIGSIRTTHQELTNRINYQDGTTFPSSFSGDDLHATHIAGTMIASGVTESARGMAWQAELSAYSDRDDIIEMADAASEGMLVSNHAYGPIFPTVSNYWFRGFYDTEAANWDKVCYLAPYYLPVNACGNDRNEVANLKYDLLLGLSNAKNPLMVGAVSVSSTTITQTSDILMEDYSSFGPTDDGRVKPDLVALGQAIISSNNLNDGGYSSLSGTSMASAAVSGSLLLLQQYYQSIHQVFLRASTLKALIIHTAYETGSSDGPDYEYGWGMLNMQAATKLISLNQDSSLILENTLQQDEVFTYPLISTGEDDLKITLCWTDPPAIPLDNNSSSLDDRTSRLVNDLDIRLLDIDGNEIALPWKLDPENPESPAKKGDNIVDVVEQIIFKNPQKQVYTLQVSHKGILKDEKGIEKNKQAFSLIATGINANITATESFPSHKKLVIYPNPSDNEIFLENTHQYSELQVLDSKGKPLEKYDLASTNSINISHLSSGVYYLKFIGNEEVASHPIIKY